MRRAGWLLISGLWFLTGCGFDERVPIDMTSLSQSQPLGKVAGTAASVFGFTQTIGGALIGTYIGQHYDGTLVTNAIGYASMGALVLICVLIAENGKLFGVGAQYAAKAGH